MNNFAANYDDCLLDDEPVQTELNVIEQMDDDAARAFG